MVSKFSPGDYVKYLGKLYLVKTVVLANPNISIDPFIYGLIPAEKPNTFNQLTVRESLLTKADPPVSNKTKKVLYGN